MTNTIGSKAIAFVSAIALLAGLFGINTYSVSAQAPETVTVNLEKKFSGPVPEGYSADQFSFTVSGGSIGTETVTLTEHTNDSANGSIDLPIGTYTITEVGPDGFDPNEWRPGWYGECEGGTDFSTTITIDDGNVDHGTLDCQVDNQWRHATLNVVKEFEGDSAPYEDFSFTVTQGSFTKHDGPFDSSGTTVVTLGSGDYSVVETVYGSYTPSYSEGCSGTMEFEGNATCVITNTGEASNDHPGCTDPEATNYDPDATVDDGSCEYDNGGGGGDDPKYKVFGYVWHDENENDEWDGFGVVSTTTEDDLEAWTVTITDGETTLSTTTDPTGYYEFYVPAGVWTISETLQDGWSQTFPNNVTHVVEVIDETLTQADETSLYAKIMNTLIPTAHAQSQTTYGPFNFGNYFTGGNGGGGNGGGGNGGGGGSSSSGGGSSKPICREFDAAQVGAHVILSWDTVRGREMTITANGVEIFATSDDDIIDEGSTAVDYSGDTTYELTVIKGSRSDTCEAAIDNGGGTGGGTPQILGDQVSVVPQGAANAGAGGSAPAEPVERVMSAALLAARSRRNV